jgi:uncharacterized protein
VSPLDLSGLELAVVIGAGLVGGFVNTVAGGGSLLTLPALMLAGIPPTVANGTNRVAILMQSSAAAARFDRAGALSRPQALRLAAPTLVGAGLGAYGASVVSDEQLEPIILVVLVVIATIFAFRPAWVTPSAADVEAHREGPLVWGALFVVGLYGGFLQAGVGFVFLTVLAGMLRMDLTRANALKVALVVPYTLLALAIFAMADQVDWALGALLGVSSVAGAWLGVRVALTRTAWLRWLVLGAVVTCAAATGLRRLG